MARCTTVPSRTLNNPGFPRETVLEPFMMRRDFMRLTAATPLLFSMAPARSARQPADDWRTFELTCSVDLATQKGAGQLWLPLPVDAGDYQRAISLTWKTAPEQTARTWDTDYRAPMFTAGWAPAPTNTETRIRIPKPSRC